MRGRPPLAPEKRLTETLHIRLTKEELDRVQVRALRAGLSVNVWIREYLRRNNPTQP